MKPIYGMITGFAITAISGIFAVLRLLAMGKHFTEAIRKLCSLTFRSKLTLEKDDLACFSQDDITRSGANEDHSCVNKVGERKGSFCYLKDDKSNNGTITSKWHRIDKGAEGDAVTSSIGILTGIIMFSANAVRLGKTR